MLAIVYCSWYLPTMASNGGLHSPAVSDPVSSVFFVFVRNCVGQHLEITSELVVPLSASALLTWNSGAALVVIFHFPSICLTLSPSSYHTPCTVPFYDLTSAFLSLSVLFRLLASILSLEIRRSKWFRHTKHSVNLCCFKEHLKLLSQCLVVIEYNWTGNDFCFLFLRGKWKVFECTLSTVGISQFFFDWVVIHLL